MAGGMQVKVDGLDVLSAKLRTLGADIHKELGAAGEKGMLVLEGEIKQRAPTQTGNYRDSWSTKVSEEGSDIAVTTGTALLVDSPGEPGSKDFPLGIYLEYGTGIYAEGGDGRDTPWRYIGSDGEWHATEGMHPQPHVRPAIDATNTQIGDVVRAALEAEIRRRVS